MFSMSRKLCVLCHSGSIEYECMRLWMHVPMRDSFMRARAHASTQRALDFPILLIYFDFRTDNFENLF